MTSYVGFSVRVPMRFLRGNYRRLALSVLALALGVALVCAIDLVNRAVLSAFEEVIDKMAGRASLQINPGEAGMFRESVVDVVREVEGVKLAVPVVTSTAFTVEPGASGESLAVHAFDLANDAAREVYGEQRSGTFGELSLLNKADAVVLTRTFATRKGLKVGSPIELTTPAGRHRFTVEGLIEPQGIGRVYGGKLVVMDLFAAEETFTSRGFINRVDVVLQNDAEVVRAKQVIERRLAAQGLGGLRVDRPEYRKDSVRKITRSLGLMLQAAGWIGLVAAFLIAFNRLATVFEARAWQLGIMRAVGIRSRTVWWELVKESLLLGAAGVVLGILLGILLAHAFLPVVLTTTALTFSLAQPDAELSLHTSSLALAALVGFGTACLAASAPAWLAARQSIADTLRHRGLERLDARSRAMVPVLVATAAGLIAAIAMQAWTRSGQWGLVATSLGAVLTALSAQPLVRLMGSRLLPWVTWLAGPSGRFAGSAILHNPRRVALTTATLGVGLGSVMWLLTVAKSFEESLVETFTGVFRADLAVASSNVTSGFFEAPLHQELVAELQRLPGVTSVAAQRQIDWHYRGKQIMVSGFDPAYFLDARFGEWPLHAETRGDAWSEVARGAAVVVSSNLAENFGANVGDVLPLETPNGPLSIVIAGITTDFASPQGVIEMSREVYRRFWNDDQVNRVFALTAPGQTDTVRQAIDHTLAERYGLTVRTSADVVQYFADQVRQAFHPVLVLTAMVLLVVLVGMADTLAAAVAERTRQIGAIRAVGIQRRFVRRMIMTEALLMGVLGLALALLSGLGLGILWVTETFRYLLGWVLELHVPYLEMAAICLMTLAVCAVAGLLPAQAAAALEPASALRYE